MRRARREFRQRIAENVFGLPCDALRRRSDRGAKHNPMCPLPVATSGLYARDPLHAGLVVLYYLAAGRAGALVVFGAAGVRFGVRRFARMNAADNLRWRSDVVPRGPSQSLIQGEAAAMPPTCLRGSAVAMMVLAGIGLAVGPRIARRQHRKTNNRCQVAERRKRSDTCPPSMRNIRQSARQAGVHRREAGPVETNSSGCQSK